MFLDNYIILNAKGRPQLKEVRRSSSKKFKGFSVYHMIYEIIGIPEKPKKASVELLQ